MVMSAADYDDDVDMSSALFCYAWATWARRNLQK